ncbi:MAG: SPFH/Band 7/PHB domain protein [Cyanothece sp. SIO2G6]|nr:SPFH/Band 7/PHB domain protein [Cyanothece sp. SIO2G6]
MAIPFLPILIVVLLTVGCIAGSIRIIRQGYEALVERLGRYHRKLTPGINFVVPIFDQIVWMETTREKLLNFPAQPAITSDNVTLEIDAIVYWRVLELQQMYYTIENVEDALESLAITTLRSQVGTMSLQDLYSSRQEINRTILQQLDEATATWGVKVTRVEVENIDLPQTLRDSLELERAAESKKRAAILEAEGRRQAAIAEAEGTVASAKLIAEQLAAGGQEVTAQDVLRYLVAQRYVEANYQLGKSENAKIVFMDPKSLTDSTVELMQTINQPNPRKAPVPPNPTDSRGDQNGQ